MKPNFYSRGSQIGTVKILLFSFFVTFFSFKGYSQKTDPLSVNAYYLSKDLYSFLRKYDPKIPEKDSAFAKKTLAKLYYYFGTDEPGELQEFIGSSNLLDSLLNNLRASAKYIQKQHKIDKILLMDNPDIITPFKEKYKSNEDVLKSIEKLNHYIIDSLKLDPKTDTLRITRSAAEKIQVRLVDIPAFREITKISPEEGFFFINYRELIKLEDSIKKMKSLIESRFVSIFDSLSVYTNYKNRLGINTTSTWTNIEVLNPEFTKSYNQVQQQDAQITISLLESSSGSISGFKIPSEAEMIDAVATYIASRVKQETVLWFFDQMRSNTERYQLIMTAFPETMVLLQSSDIFDAPNMGSSWKYALSKDFIRLPKNILSSEWIKERIPKKQQKYLDLASVAWEVSELVDNRLSYRDMLKQLYLNHELDEEKENLTFSDSIINFLYSISNELYVIKEESVRNLTYEEISSMPFGQLEIMLELLNKKYKNSVNNLFLDELTNQITKDDKQKISKWIGNSLLALSQFDKILQQVEQRKNGKDQKQTAVFDGYNTWKLISQVLESAIPAKKQNLFKPYIDRADDAFEIYHLLSEKNYAGAVSKTLELVDSLIYNTYLIIDTNNYHKDSPFLIPFSSKSTSGRYRIDINTLDKYFTERRVKSEKFPKIARHLNKGDIVVTFSPKNTVQIGDQNYIKVNKDTLMIALKKGEHSWEENRINHFFKQMNKSALDGLIKNRKNWGGHHIDSSFIQFPINSIAAQAIISSDKKAMQMIMRLASFLNDVSLSNNEKELKKVIESYALPPGSYKQKRNAWHSFSLNAFAGPYFGYETSSILGVKTKSDTIRSFGWNYGISAPIGITYTKTFGKRIFNTSRLPTASQENPDIIKIRRNNLYIRTNWSLSLSLTFVDIGAVVSYRMSNTDKVLDQSFKWEQFISPGLNLGISIPKTPLMVQMGYQYTPKVRRIYNEKVEGNEIIQKDMQIGMWRAYVGVFFDIPLVNLWMKTRSVKFE